MILPGSVPARNRGPRGLSVTVSADRQQPHSGAQSPRVREEVGSVAYPLENKWSEMASSGSVPPEYGRFGGIGGLFHRKRGVVASRLPPRPTTRAPLRVVPRVQPGADWS